MKELRISSRCKTIAIK